MIKSFQTLSIYLKHFFTFYSHGVFLGREMKFGTITSRDTTFYLSFQFKTTTLFLDEFKFQYEATFMSRQ